MRPIYRVVGLHGAAGCGKSTAAEFLTHFGYARVRFADPLKAMLRAYLAAAGAEPDYIERCIEGDFKETDEFRYLLGRSPRFAMQTLGTEWGREIMGAEFWTCAWASKADSLINIFNDLNAIQAQGVVAEDMRFENEQRVLREVAGQGKSVTIHIVRPGQEAIAQSGHKSEAGLHCDWTVLNDGPKELLLDRIIRIVNRGVPFDQGAYRNDQ